MSGDAEKDLKDTRSPHPPAEINGIPRDIFRRTPGIFRRGSDFDKAMLEQRAPARLSHSVKPIGDFVDAGILPKEQAELHLSHFGPIHVTDGHPLLSKLDHEMMYVIDCRLRICRAILENGFPIRFSDDGKPLWDAEKLSARGFEAAPNDDPFDTLGHSADTDLNLPKVTPEYYALKLLRHWRRFEAFASQGATTSEAGVVRELTLFGETWAEARSTITLGCHTVRGKSTLAASAQGGEQRAGKLAQHTEAILEKMAHLHDEGRGLTISAAARVAHKNGLGASANANRQLWKNHVGAKKKE